MSDERPRHPFAFRDFRAFWIARVASNLAQHALAVVIGWQVYDIARRTMPPAEAALQLGLIGLVQFVPILTLTLVAGWTADRVDRRWIGRVCLSLQFACAGLLGWTTATGRISLVILFAVAGLLGIAKGFSQPALNALAPNLVPRDVLPRAIATNAIATRVGAIAGPAAGGYLYAWSPHMPYAAAAVLIGVAIASLSLVRPVERAMLDGSRNPWRQMLEGLEFVFGNRLVFGAISLDMFAVLLGGATAMLPIFARDILMVGPSGLGHLRAAPAVGAMAAALWFSWWPLRSGVGAKMLIAVGVFGMATVGFGLSRSMPLSLGFLVTLGAADMLSVYVRQTLVQLFTPDVMRGRVGAVSTLFVSASNELGEAESGFLAALIGPVAAVVAGGAGAVVIALAWARMFPALRQAGRFDGS